MATWANTTLATTSDLAVIETEINELVQGAVSEYFSDGYDISSDGKTNSVDCKGGMIEVVCKVATELTIKDTKSLTIDVQDSADDSSFSDIYTGGILYTKTASGDETISADTELFRFVIPTTANDYIQFDITSDATNSGTIDFYTVSKWENKYTVAKEVIKNYLETVLVGRGYKDYVDYSDDEVLIDLIINPSTFALACKYLWLHFIFRDLAASNSVDSIYQLKSEEYKKDYENEIADACERINLDLDLDADTDEYKAGYTPKLVL